MESLNLLQLIQHLPVSEGHQDLSTRQLISIVSKSDSSDPVIETACGTESILVSLFENRNVPDSLKEAYKASFGDSQASLYQHYEDVLHRGEEATRGFLSNIKGKLFELHLEDNLHQSFPDYDFSIASDPTNPIWDLKGVNIHDGTEVLIQAKMGAADYTSEVLQRMHENPDVLFATSSEIHDAILSAHPELADQLINADISNYDFTDNVHHNLQLLADNFGIDVPDSVGDILPYVSEIILGIRLILDIIHVQRDFRCVSATHKTRVSAVKAIVLMSRFGVSTTCTTLGSAAGSAFGSLFPGPGTLLGGIGGGVTGAFGAWYLNKHLKPYYMDFALGIFDMDKDDLFYLQNKMKIDCLALSFAETSA